jgi:hypothetical protein
MLVFLAELSTRTTTTSFISHYGNDAYYAHNDELQVDEVRKGLSARVRELTVIEDEIHSAQFLETQALDMGGAAGLGHAKSKVQPIPNERAKGADGISGGDTGTVREAGEAASSEEDGADSCLDWRG